MAALKADTFGDVVYYVAGEGPGVLVQCKITLEATGIRKPAVGSGGNISGVSARAAGSMELPLGSVQFGAAAAGVVGTNGVHEGNIVKLQRGDRIDAPGWMVGKPEISTVKLIIVGAVSLTEGVWWRAGIVG